MINDLATHPVRWLTTAELATYWSVSTSHIRRLAASGKLRALRLSANVWRISTKATREFERAARDGRRRDISRISHQPMRILVFAVPKPIGSPAFSAANAAVTPERGRRASDS
jgi:excisionase family DNA binding protein